MLGLVIENYLSCVLRRALLIFNEVRYPALLEGGDESDEEEEEEEEEAQEEEEKKEEANEEEEKTEEEKKNDAFEKKAKMDQAAIKKKVKTDKFPLLGSECAITLSEMNDAVKHHAVQFL